MRKNYWSCSKFANWLRGTDKLRSGTAEEWSSWKKEAKTKYPIRYYIAEELLDKIQNTIHYPTDKLYDIKYYINNRYITHTHSLTAHPRDIPRGEWRDVGNRFLPCLFNELVDFVEVELAWWHLAWSPEERPKYNMPWWAVGWWRVRAWRCPQAGIDSLKWQMNLKWSEEECSPGSPNIGQPTYQAISAKEIYELYTWWKEVYPNRPDPHDLSGWSEYCNRKRDEFGDDGLDFMQESKNPDTVELGKTALDKSHEIEEQYKKEDEMMMIRLIKIRDSLWT